MLLHQVLFVCTAAVLSLDCAHGQINVPESDVRERYNLNPQPLRRLSKRNIVLAEKSDDQDVDIGGEERITVRKQIIPESSDDDEEDETIKQIDHIDDELLALKAHELARKKVDDDIVVRNVVEEDTVEEEEPEDLEEMEIAPPKEKIVGKLIRTRPKKIHAVKVMPTLKRRLVKLNHPVAKKKIELHRNRLKREAVFPDDDEDVIDIELSEENNDGNDLDSLSDNDDNDGNSDEDMDVVYDENLGVEVDAPHGAIQKKSKGKETKGKGKETKGKEKKRKKKKKKFKRPPAVVQIMPDGVDDEDDDDDEDEDDDKTNEDNDEDSDEEDQEIIRITPHHRKKKKKKEKKKKQEEAQKKLLELMAGMPQPQLPAAAAGGATHPPGTAPPGGAPPAGGAASASGAPPAGGAAPAGGTPPPGGAAPHP